LWATWETPKTSNVQDKRRRSVANLFAIAGLRRSRIIELVMARDVYSLIETARRRSRMARAF